MKKAKSALLLILCVLLLAGCRTHSKNFDVVACASFAVPGMICNDLKGRGYTCEILETDAQGRVLFSYATKNLITGEEETAVVICQASTSRRVCFYEDICYYFGKPDVQKTGALKEINDWGEPLDYSKMSRRAYSITLDLYLSRGNKPNYDKVVSACTNAFHTTKANIAELVFQDTDAQGSSLYWFSLKEENRYVNYFVIVNQDYEVASMSLTGMLDDAAALPEFKIQNGWVYG